MKWLSAWFASPARVRKQRPARRRSSLRLEPLEARQLLAGHTFYVSRLLGNDTTGNGSLAMPWQSLAKVQSQVGVLIGAGDTISFRAGTATDNEHYDGTLTFNGIGGNPTDGPITITNWGLNEPILGAKAPLNAGAGSGIVVRNAAGFTMQNLDVKGNYTTDGRGQNCGNGIAFFTALASGHLQGITMSNVNVHGFGGNSCSAPTGPLYEGTGVSILIQSEAPADPSHPGGGYDNVTIAHASVHDDQAGALSFVEPYGYDGLAHPYSFRNVMIDHCDAFNVIDLTGDGKKHNATGFQLFGIDGGVVQRSRAFNNGDRRVFSGSTGFFAVNSQHLLLQYNEAHDLRSLPPDSMSNRGGDPHGFNFDEQVYRSILQFNYVHEVDAAGIIEGVGLMGATSPNPKPVPEYNVIRENVVQNSGRNSGHYSSGIYVESWEASNIDIYNNTVFMSTPSIAPATPCPYAAITFCADAPATRGATVHVYNNIFYTDGVVPNVVMDPGIVSVSQNIAFQGNDYYSGGKPITIQWGTALPYQTLADFQKQTGQETLANGTLVGAMATPGLSNAGQAPAIVNIDNMSQELVNYYQLTSAADPLVKGGGLNVFTQLGLQWDTIDNFFSNPNGYFAQYLPDFVHTPAPIARDFFGGILPQRGETPFSIGASEFYPL